MCSHTCSGNLLRLQVGVFHLLAVATFAQLLVFIQCASAVSVNSLVLQGIVTIETPVIVDKPIHWSCYFSNCTLDTSVPTSESPLRFTAMQTLVGISIDGGCTPQQNVRVALASTQPELATELRDIGQLTDNNSTLSDLVCHLKA